MLHHSQAVYLWFDFDWILTILVFESTCLSNFQLSCLDVTLENQKERSEAREKEFVLMLINVLRRYSVLPYAWGVYDTEAVLGKYLLI